MRYKFLNVTGGKALLFAAIGLASGSICAAQTDAPTFVTVRCGQSNLVITVPTTPAPQVFALTGEQSQSEQSQRAWQKQTGPVYQFGNGRVIVDTPR